MTYLGDASAPVGIYFRLLGWYLKLSEFLNFLGLSRFRIVRFRPGPVSKLTRRKIESAARPSISAYETHDELRSQTPDVLASIGFRTIEAFERALNNYEFDFIVRTNTSSYVDLFNLVAYLEADGAISPVHCQTGTWGSTPYPSGALYVLNRETVEKVVQNKSMWRHEYIDDVALGLVLHRLGIGRYSWLDRFDFSFDEDRESEAIPRRANLFHYRCKSYSPSVTIKRMRYLFSQLNLPK